MSTFNAAVVATFDATFNTTHRTALYSAVDATFVATFWETFDATDRTAFIKANPAYVSTIDTTLQSADRTAFIKSICSTIHETFSSTEYSTKRFPYLSTFTPPLWPAHNFTVISAVTSTFNAAVAPAFWTAFQPSNLQGLVISF